MKKLLVSCLILFLLLSLCACGSGKNAAGTWQLSSLKSNGEDYSNALKFKSLSVTLVLNRDGTGSLDLAGETTALTWDETGITMNGALSPFTLKNDELVLSESDTEMVFTRK